jgi:hypothetical protein
MRRGPRSELTPSIISWKYSCGIFVPLNGIVEGGESRVAVILAGERMIECDAPAFQRLARGAGFVAQIVAIAHERVDGVHGVALLAGQQQKRVVEILSATAGCLAAVGIGFFRDRRSRRFAERHTGQRAFP